MNEQGEFYKTISVNDELPINGFEVISISNYNIKYKAITIEGSWNHYPFNYIDEEITHWLKPVEPQTLTDFICEGIAPQRREEFRVIVKSQIELFLK